MSAIKYFLILVLVVFTNGYRHEESHHEPSRLNRRKLLDPWGHVREACRKELGLSKKELKDLDRKGGDIEPFTTCWAKHEKMFNEDGTFSKTASLDSVRDLVPRTLSEPLMNDCLTEVYHDKSLRSKNPYRSWTEFVLCIKSRLTPEMWDLLGAFSAPTYPGFKYCKE